MQLLCGSVERRRQAADEIAHTDEWPAVIELAAQWRVLPSLEICVTEMCLEVPGTVRVDLARRAAAAFVQTTRSIRAGCAAARALDGHGIRCAAFKGLAALSYLYPSPRHRMLQDVDILIRPEDADAALKLLEDDGFRRTSQEPWNDYLAFIRNSPGYVGNEAASLSDAQGGVIDLHWRLGGIDAAAILGRVQRRRVFDSEIPVVSAIDGMLLTVHHVLRNDFVPHDVPRDVLDFVRWQDLPPSDAFATAENWGLAGACVAMEKMAAEWSDSTRPLFSIHATAEDLRSGKNLAALYFHQLQEGALNTDLAYLASHRPLRQILSGALSGWTRYRASMQESERLNGETSLPLSSRLWNLAKAAATLSPGRWQMVRSLARAKDHVSRN